MTVPGKPPVGLEDLRELLARLRGPQGCPWDRKQDPESLKIYLLEETYELAEALDRRSPKRYPGRTGRSPVFDAVHLPDL